jgi:hypothetical protein
VSNLDHTVNADAEPPAGDFYVTVRDAGRTGFLLGPYEEARDALAAVDRGRELACAADTTGRAWFYAYGTSRLPRGTAGVPVVFS